MTNASQPTAHSSGHEDLSLPLFNWAAAAKAGLIAGIIFLVMPQGSPWASLTIASGAAMGRPVPGNVALGLVLQMILALGYTFPIAWATRFVRSWRGILVGGAIGLVLYFVNYGVVRLAWPDFSGSETRVLFTHVVFGMFAAALYKGMTARSRH